MCRCAAIGTRHGPRGVIGTEDLASNENTAPDGAVLVVSMSSGSALAGFEPALRFVDHVNAAFATHNPAVTMPVFERAERVLDLHGLSPVPAARASAWCCGHPGAGRDGEFMVGDTGIEPVTPSMSTKCSTAELIAHEYRYIVLRPQRNGARKSAPVTGL